MNGNVSKRPRIDAPRVGKALPSNTPEWKNEFPCVGGLCGARYEGGKHWPADIKAVLGENTFEVYFIDDGETHHVDRRHIRKLHQSTKIFSQQEVVGKQFKDPRSGETRTFGAFCSQSYSYECKRGRKTDRIKRWQACYLLQYHAL